MQSEGSNKNIKYALGAGIAVIGAALIYALMKGGDSGSIDDNDIPDIDTEEMYQKIQREKLDQAVHDQQGRIDNQYFLKLLQFVGV